MKIGAHLVRLVLLAVVPVLLFAAAMIYMFHRQQVAVQEKSLLDAAHSLSLDIDREISGQIRSLQLLATSPLLDAGNFKSFHELSTRALTMHRAWRGIVILAPNGEQIVNTRLPFGSESPRTGNLEMVNQVIRTGKPAVSNLFIAPVDLVPVVAIGVPVIRNGKVKFIIASGVAPDFVNQLLAEFHIPYEWRGVLLDRNRKVIAHNHKSDNRFGKLMTSALDSKGTNPGSGYYCGRSQGEEPGCIGYYRSQLSGWTCGITRSAAEIAAPLRRAVLYIGAGGSLLLLFGLLLARFAARSIERPIAALVDAAGAVGRGQAPSAVAGSVTEILTVAHALDDAAARRARIEDSLRQSEARFRVIFDRAAVGMAVIDTTTGRLLRVNRKYCEILGYNETELLELDFMRITLPEDLAPDLEAMERMKSGSVRDFILEKRLLCKDGGIVWVNLSVSAMWEPGTPPSSHIAVIEDITARKLAEDQLASAERRFRALIENSGDGVALLDPTGRVHYLSPSATRVTGRLPEERIGLPFGIYHHPDDAAKMVQAIAAVISQPGSSQTVEYRTRHKDGSWRWMEAILTNRLDDPSIQAVVSNYREISARKEAEAAERAANSLLQATLNSLPLEIAVISGNGTILSVNHAWWQFAQAGQADLGRVGPGENYLATCNAENGPGSHDAKLIATGIAAVLAGDRDAFVQEYACQTRARILWFECQVTRIDDHPVARALIAHENITERKTAEQELQRIYDEIQQLHEIARTLLSPADLRSMAEAILGKALSLSACDLGIIRLRERDPNSIRVIASQGYRDPANRARHEKAAIYGGNQRTRLRAFSLQRTEIVRSLDTADRMATFKREGIRSLITIPVAVGDNLLGILQLGSRVERDFEPRLIALLETLGQDFGVALQKSQLLDETLAAQEQLRELSRRLVDTQESERRYIARELHDEIGSLLTGLKITVGMGGGSAVEQANGIIDEALAKARTLAQDLRPPMLDQLGLLPTIEWYAKEFHGRTQIPVALTTDGMQRRFAAEIEIAVFRIFQEALTNIARHAKARDAVARLACTATTLGLTIHDNGVGFDTKAALQQVTSSGLSGMRERIAALGGRITISSTSDDGTVVEVEIPLPDQGLKEAELRR